MKDAFSNKCIFRTLSNQKWDNRNGSYESVIVSYKERNARVQNHIGKGANQD